MQELKFLSFKKNIYYLSRFKLKLYPGNKYIRENEKMEFRILFEVNFQKYSSGNYKSRIMLNGKIYLLGT